MTQVFNPNPIIFSSSKPTKKFRPSDNLWMDEPSSFRATSIENTNTEEPIDQDEIFDLIRSISDPEHPNSLEELHVVSAPQITLPAKNRIHVEFTPTVPHCGMSTLIGLSIRVRLMRALPERFKVDIHVQPGSHQSEQAVNKQLNDKERVAAALENPVLLETVERCLAPAGLRGQPAL
ncbi:FAM96B protein [Flagelloscypha sp. PMI_526]|nr:FAM96B protein [Flagelloscypha sp. PMI_526]